MFARLRMALLGAALMLAVVALEGAALSTVTPVAQMLGDPAERVTLARAGVVTARVLGRGALSLAERLVAPAVSEALHGATRLAAASERMFRVGAAASRPCPRLRVIECRSVSAPDVPRAVTLPTL